VSVTKELYCLIRSDFTEQHRWGDGYGNSITAFFTSQESADEFLATLGTTHWRVGTVSLSQSVENILSAIEQKTVRYAVDPDSSEQFIALGPAEFLCQVIRLAYYEGEHARR
jgi:hypothetical protein